MGQVHPRSVPESRWSSIGVSRDTAEIALGAVIGLSAAAGWVQNVSVGPASSAGAGVPLAVAAGADTGISIHAFAPAFTGGVSVPTGP